MAKEKPKTSDEVTLIKYLNAAFVKNASINNANHLNTKFIIS